MYYVYILESLKRNFRYTGQTNNLSRRLIEHREGSTVSNRKYRPFVVEWVASKNSRKEAIKLERKLKILNLGND